MNEKIKEIFLKKSSKCELKEFIINNLLYILLFVFIIAVQIINPRFLSFESIINIMTQAAFRLPIALGVGGIIILTGTDLSAGRIVGLTACIAASLLQSSDYALKMYPNLIDLPIWLWIIISLIVVMVVGGVIGLFNGFFVSKFKLHPFIVTLATQLIVYAMTLSYIKLGSNKGQPIGGLDSAFSNFINSSISIFGLEIKYIIFYAIILTFIMWVIWNKTIIGKNMYAVGCNEEAANISGISSTKTILIVFMIAGMLYGINGLFTSAFVGSNNATTGFNFELDAIAACVIGGISFAGGVGKIKGVVLGVFLLQIITVAFIFLGVDANMQYAIKGIVILVACAIDMRKYIVKK